MNVALVAEDRTPLVIAVCLVALALRPVGWGASVVTLGIGAVGALVTVEAAKASRLTWFVATGVGVAAIGFVRLRATTPPLRMTAIGVAVSLGAAVAEELFFRRLVYSRLLRWGPSAAIAGAAALFALVHLPSYGVGAMPVDFAAGLLLGWQRWATGTWTAPAATHVFANLAAVL